jgi:uncharacterized protein (UPF0332 family)
MNGRDFLPLARQLLGIGGEPARRSAVSRAYYAAFHVARDLLTDLGFTTPRADRAHEYLYRRLNNGGLAAVRVAANQLHDLRSQRNRADYDMPVPFSAALAAGQVAAAEYVVQTLDALTAAERTQLTDAMKLYEQQIGDVTWAP